MNIFITGITRGMGAKIAEYLIDDCQVLLGTSKTEQGNEEQLNNFSSLCEKFYYMPQDLSLGTQAANNLATWAASKVEKVDCLVLNAGFYIEGDLDKFSEEDMRKNLEVNFLVNHFLVQAFLPLIKSSNKKRIIIIGSTAAYEPYPMVPSYGIAKWALRGFAINLRKEMIKHRIGVTFISPGATWTDMWEGEDLPRNRLLEPSDIAKMIKTTLQLSEQAVVEELIIRPMEGDFHE